MTDHFPSDRRERSASDGWFLLAFAALALVALYSIWGGFYLPMVDLPQHAAQIGTWTDLGRAEYRFRDHFEINWFTPYLLGYMLARALATMVPLWAALKIVISLSVLGIPLGMLGLLRRKGLDRWWALLGFPLAFGFAYGFGFFNYILAIPMGLFFLIRAWDYSRKPTVQRGVLLAILGALLFAAHALVLGLCGLVAASFVLAHARNLREILRRLVPLLSLLPVIGLWLYSTASRGEAALAQVPNEWKIGFARIRQLPETLAGGDGDLFALFLGALWIFWPILWGYRPDKRVASSLPLTVVTLLFFFAPFAVFGMPFIYRRFALWWLVLWLFCLRPPAAEKGRRFLRAGIVLLALARLAVVGLEHRAFAQEAETFRPVLEAMEESKRVLYIDLRPGSRAVRGVPYLHFASWYQAEKHGIVDFSFAMFYPELVRYRKDFIPPIPFGFEWTPNFDWFLHKDYEYFLLRSHRDAGPALFRGRLGEVHLEKRSGSWWLYRRLR